MPTPQKVYKTAFIWSGLLQLNTHEKTCRTFSPSEDGTLVIHEVPYPNHLPRVDNLEEVEVKIYNKHMFSENGDLFITVAAKEGHAK